MDNSRILARDAEIRNISGLKYRAINGIVTDEGGIKKGIPRKTPNQYLAIAEKVASIDILCTHESALISDPWVKLSDLGPATAQKMIETTRPVISLSGHLHGRFVIKHIGKTMAIRIDSSQAQRQFIIVEAQKRTIEIWYQDQLLQKVEF